MKWHWPWRKKGDLQDPHHADLMNFQEDTVFYREAFEQEREQQEMRRKNEAKATVSEVPSSSASEKQETPPSEEKPKGFLEKAEARMVRVLKPIELPKLESSFAPPGSYTNKDTDPVPPEEWTWNKTTILLFWGADLLSAGTWSSASSFTSYNMTWWQQLLAIYVGAQLISVVIALNGIVGARMHTGFAINVRASFGWYLSKFVIISRLVVAYFWLSINTYQGGIAITQMLIAIWPSYRHLKNTLSPSSGVTSQNMLSFFLLWLFQMPLCWIHPRRLKGVFLVKSITVPMVAVATLGWTIWWVKPDIRIQVMTDTSPLKGITGYYHFMSAAMSTMGIWSTMACNITDFTRYCRDDSAVYLQVVIMPLVFVFVCIFGCVVGNLLKGATGQDLFQPFDVYDMWQGSHGGRAAAFFCSFFWALGLVGTNITANSVSAGNDLATLVPRYINISRGQVIACIVGVWAFAPWKVLQSASSLVTFMSTYAVVLVPFAVVMICDFIVVQKQQYDLFELYNPHGIYRHWWGINWRAFVALVLGITPNLPGMANSLNSDIYIGNLKYLFCIDIIYGIIVTSVSYIGLSALFPHKPTQSALARDSSGESGNVDHSSAEGVEGIEASKQHEDDPSISE